MEGSAISRIYFPFAGLLIKDWQGILYDYHSRLTQGSPLIFVGTKITVDQMGQFLSRIFVL